MEQGGYAERVAVVTGGNRGIGLECARQLARAGARISLWARDAPALERAARYADFPPFRGIPHP